MASPQNINLFETYFHRVYLDHDGRIIGTEALVLFQGANLPKKILAHVPLLYFNLYLNSIAPILA